jgi:hypothetical protein
LLDGMQRRVLTPEVAAEVCRRAMKIAKSARPTEVPAKATGKLRDEIANLTSGMLRSSPATKPARGSIA